jgi:hypothetical protein
MLTKRQRINQPQPQGTKEVGGRRRRKIMKRGGGPGVREVVARGKVEAEMQQPVMVDDKRQRQDGRQRCRQTGGGGMMRWDAQISQDG